MKTTIPIGCAALAMVLALPIAAAAPEIAAQLDLSSETTPAARRFYFKKIPGQRYSL